MSRSLPLHIKSISDEFTVEYDTGKFDDWCVYVRQTGMGRFAPRDNEYFAILATLGTKYGHTRIYDDFVRVYHDTDKTIRTAVLQRITLYSLSYGEDTVAMDLWLTVLYAGMVAEENKKNTRLGKRIKRLGIYQTLVEKMHPEVAAVFSKGKKWKELDMLMQEKGF